MNEVKVPLSLNNGDQDVRDGSVDKPEESPRTIRVNNPRDEQLKDEEEALNFEFSDDGN